jgi:SAM-dependent methyltransferase
MTGQEPALAPTTQRNERAREETIAEREAIEVNFWTSSEIESPQSDSIHNILMKAAEARVFVEKVEAFRAEFAGATGILELGGGQCWASCIVKRLFSSAYVVGTDIAPGAVASIHKWEQVYSVKVDKTVACRSYEVPFPDRSFDLIFAFAAAHHFGRYRKTLVEIERLLKPGGAALFLHEPACREYLYRLAHWRVNRKRPEVPEDVLIYGKLEDLARQAGLVAESHFAPTLTNRTPGAMLYYLGLRRLPLLQQVLPCSVDMVFRKPREQLAS